MAEMDVPSSDPAGSSSKPSSSSPFKKTLLRVSTRVQAVSAISFTGFLGLHLAAPIGAGLGLDASGIMLLTREYYQTPYLEPILVWGSLGAHIASSVTRRLLLGPPKKPSPHAATGWLLIPLALGHAFTHRILPAIKGISPAFMSYQFVSHALVDYPVMSTVIYGSLAVAATYHTIAGMRLLASGRRKAARFPEGGLAATGYAMLLGTLGLGLVNLMKEGPDVPLWLAKRYTEIWDTIHFRCYLGF